MHRQLLRFTPALLLVLAVSHAATACDGGFAVGPIGEPVTSPDESSVAGLWVGTTYVSEAFDPPGAGFSFPVALQLYRDGSFTLRSVNYPPASTESYPTRFCAGVYSLRNRTLEFFPNGVCPALPLHSFGVGAAGSRLVLEAVATQVISVRVRMELERG